MKIRPWMFFVGFALVGLLLYLGTDVKSNDQKTLEKSRALVKQSKSSQALLRDAYHALGQQEKNQVDELNILMQKSSTENERLQFLEQLAGAYYSWQRYDVSGHYAEEIASARETAQAWSIAGTTYSQGIRLAKEEQTKKFCAERARLAFERASMIEPDNPDVDLNNALTYIYQPDQSNPMAGIQMLLSIKNEYPDYAPVYRNLGTFAIQTGQYEKALERLRQAWSLEGDDGKVSCLLAQTFEALNQADSSAFYNSICKN